MSLQNLYSGFGSTKSDRTINIPILTSLPTPQEFFHGYIRTRKPVVIRNFVRMNQSGWDINAWNQALQQASKVSVRVEVRENTDQRFGNGILQKFTFGQFMKRLEQGDQSLYLTAQDPEEQDIEQQEKASSSEDNGDGNHHQAIKTNYHHLLSRPRTHTLLTNRIHTPLDRFLSTPTSPQAFPLRPPFIPTGSLILQSINLWMGSSQDGTSSGLHHDYHDNVYVLLKGSKRFYLFSPADAKYMPTHAKGGGIRSIYPNGRIINAECDAREDGAPKEEADLEDARINAELKLASAEDTGDPEEIRLAEQHLENILDGALRNVGDRDHFNCFIDDYDEYNDDEDYFDDDEIHKVHNKSKETGKSRSKAKDENRNGKGKGKGKRKRIEKVNPDCMPANFCKVTKEQASAQGATLRQVHLQQGDSLYLPAGWFHEVISQGSLHTAINYWFHPPDNLDSDLCHIAPYKSSYWIRREQEAIQAINIANKRQQNDPPASADVKRNKT